MRILFVSPRQCWPANGGAKLREYHLAKALGSRASLHYVFFAAPGHAAPTRTELPFCEEIVAAPPVRPYSVGKLIRGLIGPTPLSVLNYASAGMSRTLESVAEANRFDLIHLDSIHLITYQPLLERLQPKARIIYDWHNIESDILRQYGARGPSLPRRLYSSITAGKLRAIEDQVLRSSFGHLVCSARERAQLVERVPSARIEVIENGVDTSRFIESPQAGVRDRIVFVGLMNYHANIEAAVWFARRIWPSIRARFPEFRLTLVGADPAPSVRELGSLEGVEVTGTVPDVTPFYGRAVAAVVPLLTGGGTRLKILEAMAARVPVISTELGAEGIDISPGENILIAPADAPDSERSWTGAVGAIVSDHGFRSRIIAAGRQLVESHYDWTVIERSLLAIYGAWEQTP